jgi:hypothetical protein
MRASSNASTGSTAFSTQVEKLEDGTYRATCLTIPALPAQVGETARDATMALNKVMQNWVTNGCAEQAPKA